MKKLLIFGFLALFLFSCKEKETYYISVTNGFNRTVSYVYNGLSQRLRPGETETYDAVLYSLPPLKVVDELGIASVKTEYIATKSNYLFVEADFFYVIVMNNTSFSVTIGADNYIDNNGSMSITIEGHEELLADGKTYPKIYTSNPQFKYRINNLDDPDDTDNIDSDLFDNTPKLFIYYETYDILLNIMLVTISSE